MHLGRFLCKLALAVSCALGAGVANAQTTPTLTTDRQDYSPGDSVVLMGDGFQAGETVDVSIAIDDDATGVHIGDYDWMVETAGDTGGFTTFWTVPLEAYGMTLRATALGLTSGNVATATFTDSGGLFTLNLHISWGATTPPLFHSDGFYILTSDNPAGPWNSQGILWIDNSPSLSFTVPANSPVYFLIDGGGLGGLPSSYATYWTLQNAASLEGFLAGPDGGSTTVEIAYSACSATNTAPTLAATSLSLADSCPADGVLNTTVNVSQFLPVAVDPDGDPYIITFADGSSTQDLTFTPAVSSQTLTLKVTDDPSARNQVNCPPLDSLSTTFDVTVSATVYAQPTNAAPAVSANNFDLGNLCVASSITVPVSLADFNAGATDPDGDPVALSLNGVTDATLSLPPGSSDAVVSVPVVISATDDPSARNCGVCTPLGAMTGSTIAYVTATLHRNSPPVILATNANLGDIVGLYSGGTFSKTIAVSPATFGASAVDPEGDPFTLVANVSNVTLVGPGVASATVTLTATDDPTSRTSGACSAESSSSTVQVSARIVYRFDGPLFPLNTCLATKVRRGSIVPVRFRLFDCNNTEITTVPVNPAGGPTYHTLSVAFNQANAPDGAVDVDDIGCGDTTDDFHYFLGAWTYVLQTNSTYQLHTTYIIRIYPNDGTQHDAMMSIK